MKVSPAAFYFFLKETFKSDIFQNKCMAELLSLFLIFIAGVGASSFGTLIGGAGLLIIPFLIFLGLPVTSAIGTHKAGVLGLTIAGWYEFDKKHEINYKIGWNVFS